METALSFLSNYLSRLTEEVKFRFDFPSKEENKIKTLQNELDLMNAFLKASQRKLREHDQVRKVVSNINKVAQQAEDVIDTYFVNLVRHKQGIDAGTFDNQLNLHDLNREIQNIKTTIKEIKDKYGIEKDTEAATEEGSLHRRRVEVEEDEIIGFEKYFEEVIKLLNDGDSGSPRKVVSITGKRGLGKTTYARKICESYQVEKHFDLIAWAYVPKDYRPTDILLTLLRCFMSITGSQSTSLLIMKRMMHRSLIDMRYLIVLDGISDTQVWEEIQDCFPNENNGSRILITCHDKAVAFYASQTPTFNNQTTDLPYELQPLNEADSWKLFCKRVFHEETCPDPLLEPHGRKIVQSCKGLPLFIALSAGLLLHKRLPRQWSEMAYNSNSFLDEDKESHVNDILKLSYNSLPEELKPCFLYLGIYPEDFEIPVRQLMQQWIAEGFILVKESGAEAVAEKYLCELIHRGLIQVARKRTDGGAKTCRIHDLLRDFCIFVSKEEEFFEICQDANTIKRSKPRRLSLLCSTDSYNSSRLCDHSFTRSLFCFNHEITSFYGSEALEWFLNEFNLVRVLDLGRQNRGFFDYKLHNLFYLRYFKAQALMSEKEVSSSIGRLWNLETLDTRGWDVKTLPPEIWRLRRLRNLYLKGPVIVSEPLKGAKNKMLGNLQTLSTIGLHRDNMFLLENGMFPKLRKLGLWRVTGKDQALLRLKCLTHLNTLKIFLPRDPPTSADAFPPNLTKITLKEVSSSAYMNALMNLPILRILKLSQSGKYFLLNSSESDLCFPAGGFKKLQVFQMEGLWYEKLTLEKDAIPQLGRLIINNCKQLKGLPDELWSLKALAEVQILRPSEEMAGMLQNLEKKDNIKFTVYPPLGEETDPSDN